MAKDIRIGFSMHPRWIDQAGLKAFIDPLRQAGLSVLEFELDDHLDGWPESLKLMEEAFDAGLDLSFHAPYRLPHSLVGFGGARRKSLQAEYLPLLGIAESWGKRTGRLHTVVMHAAVSKTPAQPASLQEDTLAYLLWVLETFPHIHLALENNHPAHQGEVKIGIQREEILQIARNFPADRLGICWDMGHDFLRHQPGEPSQEWYSRVIHVHLHDVDAADDDHYPLVLGNVPHQAWLRGLKEAGMKGIVVLELKGDRLQGWPMEKINQALVASIETACRETQ
jgi:sugar phosphate isomerase/epimerase